MHADDVAIMAKHQERHSAEAKPGRNRVLLADGAASREDAICTRLEQAGYDVSIASTLAEAEEIVELCRIDFALLDLRLENFNTLGLVTAVRRRNSLSRIVVHTWFADVGAAVAVTKAGADDLLPKPLAPDFVADFLVAGASYPALVVPDSETVRRKHIETVFASSNRNVSMASRMLLLNRRSLQRLIKRYDNSGS